MTNISQNLAAGFAAIALFAVTWVPVIAVPSAHASTITAMPILA